MKYFIACLGFLTSFNLSAMNSGEPDHGVNQNIQPAGHLLRLCINPYNDLSDAMKSEEYLAANLRELVQNYTDAVNSRNAANFTPDGIRVTAEYENAIGLWWKCIEDRVRHITTIRQSIKFLVNLQVRLTPVSDYFRDQFPTTNLDPVNDSEVATLVTGNLQANHGSMNSTKVTIYNSLSDAMNSEGNLACNLNTMMSQYTSGIGLRNYLVDNQMHIMVIRDCDIATDNWFGYVYSAINQISETRQSIKFCIGMRLNFASESECAQWQKMINAQNQRQVNVQNQFTRPATHAQSITRQVPMQMSSNLRHN